MFSSLFKTEIIIFVTFNLSSLNSFSLVSFKILFCGNGLTTDVRDIVKIQCKLLYIIPKYHFALQAIVPYHCVSSPKTNYSVLNNNHSYFLLVDNGTVGKYGGEIIFRKRLEKYIAHQKICISKYMYIIKRLSFLKNNFELVKFFYQWAIIL